MRFKIEARHILGIIIAVTAAWVINMETICFADYFSTILNKPTISYVIQYSGKALAIIAFCVILIIFFKYVKNSLGNYLILSILVSIIAVMIILFGTGRIITIPIVQSNMNLYLQQEDSMMLVSIIAIFYVIMLIAVFVTVFQLMIKRKVK